MTEGAVPAGSGRLDLEWKPMVLGFAAGVWTGEREVGRCMA